MTAAKAARLNLDREWTLAGITLPQGGDVGARPGRLPAVPSEIKRWRSTLLYRRLPHDKCTQVVGPDLLLDFMALADAPVDDFVSFARKWGPVPLCRHGLPIEHDGRCWSTYRPDAEGWYRVSLRRLRGWAKTFRISNAWAVAFQAGSDPRQLILAVDGFVNWCLQISSVCPQIIRFEKGPEIWLAGRSGGDDEMSIFGALAVQLMLVATGAVELTTCDGCKKPYPRRGRRAAATRENFCPRCGRRAANRRAQQRYRERRRQQREQARARRQADQAAGTKRQPGGTDRRTKGARHA